MYYRVRASIAFTDQDEARDFYHDCQLALAKGVTINQGDPNFEPSAILLEECHHEESPLSPCILLTMEATPSD